MHLERYLDPIEIQVLNKDRTHVVEYLGDLDPEALARAFALLCDHHPILRGRIRYDGVGYLLYVPNDHRPELAVLDGNRVTLQREIHGPWDPERAVARLLIIRGSRRGYVALRIDHAILDGRAWVAVIDELWRLYTGIAMGIDMRVESGTSLPCAPSDLLKQRWICPKLDTLERVTYTSKHKDFGDNLQRRIQLTTEQTTRLLTLAHSVETSVAGLVSGAIVVAQRGQDTSASPPPMVYLAPVDLRNRVSPPVGPTETTNFVAWHCAQISASAIVDPITVGRAIKDQLDAAIVRRELLLADPAQMIYAPEGIHLKDRLTRVFVSNSGVIPQLTLPAKMTIKDIQIPGRKSAPARFPAHSVRTYDGRLTIQSGYPSRFFTGKEASQIINRTERLIRSMCQ